MLTETKTMTFIFCQISQDHVSHHILLKLLCRLGNLEVNATDSLFCFIYEFLQINMKAQKMKKN